MRGSNGATIDVGPAYFCYGVLITLRNNYDDGGFRFDETFTLTSRRAHLFIKALLYGVSHIGTEESRVLQVISASDRAGIFVEADDRTLAAVTLTSKMRGRLSDMIRLALRASRDVARGKPEADVDREFRGRVCLMEL